MNLKKLDIDKPVHVPSGLDSSKTKTDYLDVDKLKPVLVDFKKLSHIADKDIVKKKTNRI